MDQLYSVLVGRFRLLPHEPLLVRHRTRCSTGERGTGGAMVQPASSRMVPCIFRLGIFYLSRARGIGGGSLPADLGEELGGGGDEEYDAQERYVFRG